MKEEYIKKLKEIDSFEQNCLTITENNYKDLLKLPNVKSINRIKIRYICKSCSESSKIRFDTFKLHPFICKKCFAKTIHSDEKIKKKTKETNLKRYGGVGFASTQIMKKYRETMKNKTGEERKNYCDYNKMVETRRRKYGEHLETLVCKIKKTKQDKYGDEKYNNTQKMYETNKKLYGNKCSLNNETNKQKRENTWFEKYGTKHPWSNNEIHNKCIDTTVKKYGRPNVYNKFKYDNITFDSSWELAFYIYLKDHQIKFTYHPEKITYLFNNDKHLYFPDFKIYNTLVEIKSPYLYNKLLIENTKDNAKLKCMNENNVKIILNCDFYLNYVEEKYGKDYIKSFKFNCSKEICKN